MTFSKPYLFVLVLLGLAVMACTGTLAEMLLSGQPVFQCPTAIPVSQPTAPPGYPTTVPQPIATPVIIRPPQAFYPDDRVDVGGVEFRLSQISVRSGRQPIALWRLDVTNQRSTAYSFFPAGQMQVSVLSSGQRGAWGASSAAATEAGIAFRYESYRLNPGESQSVQLAAYIPSGAPAQFTYRLDPTTEDTSAVLTWVNQPNPYC